MHYLVSKTNKLLIVLVVLSILMRDRQIDRIKMKINNVKCKVRAHLIGLITLLSHFVFEFILNWNKNFVSCFFSNCTPLIFCKFYKVQFSGSHISVIIAEAPNTCLENRLCKHFPTGLNIFNTQKIMSRKHIKSNFIC